MCRSSSRTSKAVKATHCCNQKHIPIMAACQGERTFWKPLGVAACCHNEVMVSLEISTQILAVVVHMPLARVTWCIIYRVAES